MHTPLRMCIACRKHKPKAELLRFGIDNQTRRIARRDGKSHEGRGVYVCRSAVCLKLAEKKRMAERQLKAEACAGSYEIPEDMI